MRIATKTNVLGTAGGLRPETLKEHLNASLERLQTGYADLYYAHRDDPETPQDEVAGGFHELLSAGLIRETGASNFSAERLSAALRAAKSIGVKGYGVLQNQLNLLERGDYPEALQNVCIANDIAMLPFCGLASGYLTGKYRKPADFDKYPRGERVRGYAEHGRKLLPIMDRIAEENEATLGQIALAWLLTQPGVAAPVASATTADQVDDLVEAMETELTTAQIAELTAAI